MHIIPVIDLLNGVVVHAKQGARANYQPIQSRLTNSHKALDIIIALLDLYPFTQLYIADLNAIQKLAGNHFELVSAICARFPALEIWLDAGLQTFTQTQAFTQTKVRRIVGSENFTQLNDYLAIKDQHILSLDFMYQNTSSASQSECGFQGCLQLLDNEKYWPQEVIVMSLANVGANAGVNVALLQNILNRASDKNIYAAGGVRGLDDLVQLKNMGIHGALIATALHQKQLSASDIKALT